MRALLLLPLFAATCFAELAPLSPIQKGYKKADTPSWCTVSQSVIFTDLEAGELYQLPSSGRPKLLRKSATRGKMINGAFIGIIDGHIGQWKPGDAQVTTLLKEGVGGRSISLNDITVSSTGIIYFTTLKDPEKGRVTKLDPKTGKTVILFDGSNYPELSNPNGIALNADEDTLLIGISNYKQRKFSAIYAFPILEDGTIDVETGKKRPVISVRAPDGIFTDSSGNIFFTAGKAVHVYSPEYKPIGQIKIPKGSGTNLCLGGTNGKTLYVTTRNTLYSAHLPESFQE